MQHKRNTILALTGLAFMLVLAAPCGAARLKDLCEVRGARSNEVIGVGVVVGLAGTGDGARLTVTTLERLFDRLGIKIENLNEITSDNSAVVTVTATIPAAAKSGTRIDCRVESPFDCESLEGGTLLMTYLQFPGDPNETVYAIAQGPISVGGFNADAGGGTSVRKNHVTSGRIPMGAYVENEIPTTITDGERIVLRMKQPDFQNAYSIQKALNQVLGKDAALALGMGTIRVTIPENERDQLIGFIARLQDIEVKTTIPTRVVINENTGTIVMGGNVLIKPAYVAHGGLTIKIASTPVVTPPPIFSDAAPVVTELKDIEVEESTAFFMPVQGTTAGEVAEALNKLQVTPRDMIAIFQALRKLGALEADLETM